MPYFDEGIELESILQRAVGSIWETDTMDQVKKEQSPFKAFSGAVSLRRAELSLYPAPGDLKFDYAVIRYCHDLDPVFWA